MKYYKVISNNKAKDGGNFDYTDYLPKQKKDGTWNSGKWTPRIKNIIECESGYHVTRYWNMWLSDVCEIYEVEVKGLQKKLNHVGVSDKEVCKSLRFIKKVEPSFKDKQNTGNWNVGYRNTGNWNTGNWNTGNRNTGNRNMGNRNTGDRNRGNRNTGYWNTGNRNTGNRNMGNRNTGDSNRGNRNTGYWNTGSWNTGHWNTGFFNTITQTTILVFNKECSREAWEDATKPEFLYFDIIDNDYKKSFRRSFKNAKKEDVELLIKLPNFDYDVFKEISGISEAMIQRKLR